jgi:hypothetical protein
MRQPLRTQRVPRRGSDGQRNSNPSRDRQGAVLKRYES